VKSIYEQEYRVIIERIIARRKELGLTQAELARRIGPEFDQTIVSKVETCLRRLDIIETRRICEALDMEILDLFKEIE